MPKIYVNKFWMHISYKGTKMNTTTPIEFMAWDDTNKRFVNNILYRIDGKGDFPESHTLMQLTALRSMIDEPIYNHMIVMIQIGNHYLVDMFDYRKMNFLMVHELVIVGNRFQNPELLELCE